MVPSLDTRPSLPPPSLTRPVDTDAGHEAVAEHVAARPQASVTERGLVALLADHAPGLLPLVQRDPDLATDVLVRPLEQTMDEAAMRDEFASRLGDVEDGSEFRRELRLLRHRHIVRIAAREILRVAPVSVTAGEVSALAAAALEVALRAARRAEVSRHGEASDGDGRAVPLVVLGMGKLGGWELNIGSDVDLCFFHEPSADARVGDGLGVSLDEFLTRVARRTAQAIGEVTADGFVFRVDLRLRPEGSRGALVPSIAAAERYYETLGRTWERAVLLRSRPVAGDLAFGTRLLEALTPFVFRRAVDPRLAEAMHDMVRRAREELSAAPARDLKLGRGGIREVEFFVQTLQLIWGGRHPSLQPPGTLSALHRLSAHGYVTPAEAQTLERAWELLRRAEHRVQCRAGYVTHDIPAVAEERDALARSLGFPDGAEFERVLGRTRRRVAAIFDSLVPSDGARERRRPYIDLAEAIATSDFRDREEGARPLGEHGAELLQLHDPDEAEANLRRMSRGPASPFHPIGRNQYPDLAPELLQAIGNAADRAAALRCTSDLVQLAGHGVSALLADHPRLTRRLVTLFGASRTLSEALLGRPAALGETLAGTSSPDAGEIARQHADALAGHPTEDVEGFVSEHRELKRRHTLRIGMAHVDGELGLEDTTRLLTELADEQIRWALDFATRETAAKLGEAVGARAGFVVLGVGKLGGHELGFGSDLDLVFLREGDGDVASVGRETSRIEVFSRVAQRTMRLLSQTDSAGPGYEADPRLRPSGNQGHLVVSLEGFTRYHREKAESWERLVLLRARVVGASSPGFATATRATLHDLLRSDIELDPARLAELRARMQRELSGERPDRWNAKLGYGGLLDIELATQFTQLRHGVTDVAGTRAAIEALDRLGLLAPHEARGALEALHFFRLTEQAIALHDPHASARMRVGGPRADAVARATGVLGGAAELETRWRRHAAVARRYFATRVAPIDQPPPWR